MFSLSDAGVLEAPEVCESFYDTLNSVSYHALQGVAFSVDSRSNR